MTQEVMMELDIKKFCEDIPEVVEPYRLFLETLRKQLDRFSDRMPVAEAALQLADIENRLNNLSDKVEGQNTYLIIFGPLKSGKSTLMNAISGAYVSEVSSLPAYPCLVYVRDSRKSKFSLTLYNGTRLAMEDGEEVESYINEGHVKLARRLQEVEAEGDDFDPRVHATDAIRRVDIALPAKHLGEAKIVLVDTPGLYTRMKFGYGLMTREFRYQAACAVFVVKVENLFLEQVFNEFEDLLKEFSRVFLVVNVNRTKMDLAPDGSLRPSIESKEPQKLVEVFETLSMNNTLHQAYENGRLRIYAIDLLTAASQRLSAGRQKPAKVDGLEGGEGDGGTARFDAFLGDLTEYLNSDEYLYEFMRDSIRQGELCAADAQAVTEGSIRTVLEVHRNEVKQKLAATEDRLEGIQAARGIDWKRAVASGATLERSAIDQHLDHRARRLDEELEKTLNSWYNSDDSLHELLAMQINPKIRSMVQASHDDLLEQGMERVKTATGGAALSEPEIRLLEDIELPMEGFVSERVMQFGSGASAPTCEFGLNPEAVPVIRTFWDKLFFRNEAKVRRRTIGEGKFPGRPIPPAEKEKRLGGEFRELVMRKASLYGRDRLNDVKVSAVDNPCLTYQQALCVRAEASILERQKEKEEERRGVVEQLQQTDGLVDHMNLLGERSEEVLSGLRGLGERYLTERKPAPASALPAEIPALESSLQEAPVASAGLVKEAVLAAPLADAPEPTAPVAESDEERVADEPPTDQTRLAGRSPSTGEPVVGVLEGEANPAPEIQVPWPEPVKPVVAVERAASGGAETGPDAEKASEGSGEKKDASQKEAGPESGPEEAAPKPKIELRAPSKKKMESGPGTGSGPRPILRPPRPKE